MSSTLPITAESVAGPRPVVRAGSEVSVAGQVVLGTVIGQPRPAVLQLPPQRVRQSLATAPWYGTAPCSVAAPRRVVDVPAHAATVRPITRKQTTGLFDFPTMTKRARASALERSP